MNKETPVMRAIREAVNTQRDAQGRLIARLVRNQVGFDAMASSKYGLGKGSADLVGMIRGGRVFAIEVKTATGRLSPEQKAWMAAVNAWGGYACCARSVEEALAHLRTAVQA